MKYTDGPNGVSEREPSHSTFTVPPNVSSVSTFSEDSIATSACSPAG